MSNSTRQIEISLGADQVREWLIQRCKSEAGAEWVWKAQFSTKFGLVRQWHAQVREMMTLISSGDVPNRQFYDLENYLIQVRAEGTCQFCRRIKPMAGISKTFRRLEGIADTGQRHYP